MINRRYAAVLLLALLAIISACRQSPEEVVIEVTRVVTETVEIEGEQIEVTRVVTETEMVEVTRVVESPAAEEMEMESTDRTGPWVDTVVVVEEPSADAAVSRLQADDLDVYAYAVSTSETVDRILQADDLNYTPAYGSYNELSLNPAACVDSSQLNPFSSRPIREAMNWLIDRDYIAQEIMGGQGVPRYVPVNNASPDRARLAVEIREIETKYAYDFERAREIITTEMEAIGATLEDGTWMFQGAPVELLVLIRTEDERQQIGDYAANQLEDVGFTVIRDYKTSAEAAPIWQGTDPAECAFHVYTGGWVSPSVPRDAGANFLDFYTPAGLPISLWQAYTPTDEFAELAQRLFDNDFANMEERRELFARAFTLALEDSVRIWLVDRISVAPYQQNVEVSSDLSGSIYGSWFWPYTLRRTGEVGGSITWAMPSILTQPWNPIAGSNWIYDQALIRAAGSAGILPDPATGLSWPHRIEQATITVQEGLPVIKTLDWLTLETAPEIAVPEDAWVDWDAAAQRFLTAGEVYTETQTALLKSVVTYPDDLYETIKWHDGSNFDVADVVLYFILQFDPAKPESAIFDEAQVPALDAFLATFRGMRIVSEDPLVIEYYTDNFQLDAETAVTAVWPFYDYGEAGWHTMALGILAEAQGLAAFSAPKATANNIERLNYLAGPTVEILNAQLGEAAENGHIPYEPTMSQYITAEEAATRYANLQEFHRRYGHFWVGTGPFFIQRAFPVEGTVILERNRDYPDPADRWARFTAPPIPVVELDGPGRVSTGEEATYDVFVDADGAPYPAADVEQVQYLVIDSSGEIVSSGMAENVEDGLWQLTIPEDLTAELEAGSNRLEVLVVSSRVALPVIATLDFVTAP